MIKRHGKISTETEDKITTGFVISKSFIRDLKDIYKPEYMKTAYSKRIISWCIEYYDNRGEAPYLTIADIYDLEKSELTETDQDLISTFLFQLSEKYDADSYNWEFHKDNAIKYFQMRSMEVLADGIKAAIGVGNLERAKTILVDYNKPTAQPQNLWYDPFEKSEIVKTFEDEDSNRLFKMPGVLGEMIGYFERGMCFAVMGPMKRGKSFWLDEIAYHGAYSKLKVAKISFEMNKTKINKRLYKRWTGLGDYDGDFYYPIFDCLKNQDNSCSRKDRKCRTGILDSDGIKMDFTPDLKYKSCDYCRELKNGEFIPDVWYEQIYREKITPTKVISAVSKFKSFFGDRFRVLSYPSFSAGVNQMERDLDMLYQTTGYSPDIITWDYPNITRGDDRKDERTNTDSKWKFAKRLAEQRHCLVAPAHQGGRSSINKTNMNQTDTSEDIRILAHVDGLLAINQTPYEKAAGVIRLNMLVARESDFGDHKQVMVLYNPKVGQTNLDSEWVLSEY